MRSWWSAVRLAVHDAYRIYHPASAKPGRTPEQKGMPMRPVHLTTSRDGVRLAGWFVPGTGPHTVVVCHGMGRTKSAVLDHIRLLHDAGHHVFAYDLRNHGASGADGRLGRMATRFTRDLHDVLTHLAADPETGGGKLAVLALSFSTWPAVEVLRLPGPEVAAVICDSGPMYDIPAGFRHFAGLRWSTLPEGRRWPGARLLYRTAFALAGTRMLGSIDWPPRLLGRRTRMLFIVGAQDPVVPVEQVRRVARCYPDAEFWVAPAAQHMNAVRLEREEYRARVLGLLAEAFGGAR